MEARIEAEFGHFYGMAAADYRSVSKRSSEWKLDNWKWDGDLFLARSLNPAPSEYPGHQFLPVASANVTAGNSYNASSSFSDEVNIGFENGKREMEKRRRVVVAEDDNTLNDKVSSLGLNLGGQGYPIANRDWGSPEGNSAKKTKIVGSSTSRAICQVEDCQSDLSMGKDYHRRHKVCEMHSKASQALVGNIMQRFCQQCSRFHDLQEFDEGKRSCRRRLAGHNKRRRKTNPEPDSNASAALNDESSSFLLISLLKILTNMHNNQSKEATDSGLLTHLLRILGGNEVKNVIGGVSDGKIEGVHTMISNAVEGTTSRPMLQPQTEPTACNINGVQALAGENPSGMQNKPNNFDLNDVYINLDDSTEDLEAVPTRRTYSVDFPSWMYQGSHQLSPPQMSRTSDSASAQSPSSSTGDPHSRTDRIVFKLFGKQPNDFPLLVRAQILDWLAHTPTDIESYIRPGCVILTIYLRQSKDAWEELCYDFSSSLSRLVDVSDDTFWKIGWTCIRIQHHMRFIYNGRVVLDRSLPFESVNSTKILSVRPIAVSASESTQFLVRGINLTQPATRLLCALEGKYLLQESVELLDEDGSSEEHDELQCVKFSCSIPRLTGRGFIEIEEDGGLSSSFFPFLIAEEDVCSEIRTLETSLELLETDSTSGEMEFINEMGWILHRSGTRSRLAHLDPNQQLFSFTRFRWLMEFSMDRDWSAVVKKLLDIVLDGSTDSGDYPSLYAALLDMCLVHRAVRRNNRALVELLLRYVPQRVADNLGPELDLLLNASSDRVFLFKPNDVGPRGLTPLHIAAGKDGSEEVLDALTDDPGTVGLQAWKNARDSTGSTPEDYARIRGHYSYIHLIQSKINRRHLPHVTLDIPAPTSNTDPQDKASLEIMKTNPPKPMVGVGVICKMCEPKLSYGIRGKSLPYRPAMLSMVAIAAVCVCVALLFKSCPEVLYVFGPFRWELLEYGAS